MTGKIDLKDFEGRGFYPSFHALWHLKSLGVAKALDPFESDIWEKIAKDPSIDRVSVAIIDGPIAHDHPNLVGAIDLVRMRDFSVYDDGEFLVDVPNDKQERLNENVPTNEQERLSIAAEADKWASSAPKEKKAVFEAIAKRIRQEVDEIYKFAERRRPPARPLISGPHGTALAGLIGGRPVKVRLAKTDPVKEEPLPDQADTEELPLPYAGVNPFCRIIPISTTVSPDPAAVEAALAYALLVKPDVVVIAIDWPDATVMEKSGRKVAQKWQGVADLVLKLAENSIVVCAAGNTGSENLAFPAWLADGKAPRLWAVTACTAKGAVVSYAPELGVLPQMLNSLSTDAERYERDGVLHDPWAEIDPEIDLPELDSYLKDNGITSERLGIPTSLVATDCPGPFGYNPSPYRYTPKSDGVHLEMHSLYCLISGSSTATGLAAGLISLAMMEKKSGNPDSRPVTTFNPVKLFDFDQAKSIIP